MASKINSRNKGMRGELEVCKLFHRWFPDTHRNGEIQRSKVNNLPDIGGEIEKYFYVEVKRYKKITAKQIFDFYKKMWEDYFKWLGVETLKEKVIFPIILIREDRKKWWVLVELEDAGRLGLEDKCKMQFMVGMHWVERVEWQDFQDAMDKKLEVKND